MNYETRELISKVSFNLVTLIVIIFCVTSCNTLVNKERDKDERVKMKAIDALKNNVEIKINAETIKQLIR